MFSKDKSALSVTQLVRRVRNLLEIELGEVWVEGEVSNLRRQASGHIYFSLKDDSAQLPAVMFRGRAKQGGDYLADGKKVRIFGEATVYEAAGRFQVIVQKVEDVGLGELQAKFEALKARLAAEGLFDQVRKKEIPAFPKTVGLVTSSSAAALQDMLNVFERRAPWLKLMLFPVQVQGKGAERGIAKAIRGFNRYEKNGLEKVDVLIVGRGGGSLEDLWNFNEELVARAIAESEIPVVSAVGHEIDFTIADFVSDLRAPTPSAAAELVAPDGDALKRQLRSHRQAMLRSLENRIQRAELLLHSARKGSLSQSSERVFREHILHLDSAKMQLDDVLEGQIRDREQRLEELRTRHRAQSPKRVFEQRLTQVELLRQRLREKAESALVQKFRRLEQYTSVIKTLGPESAFKRGFSITLGVDGKPISSVESVKKGDRLRTILQDGEINSETL